MFSYETPIFCACRSDNSQACGRKHKSGHHATNHRWSNLCHRALTRPLPCHCGFIHGSHYRDYALSVLRFRFLLHARHSATPPPISVMRRGRVMRHWRHCRHSDPIFIHQLFSCAQKQGSDRPASASACPLRTCDQAIQRDRSIYQLQRSPKPMFPAPVVPLLSVAAP